MEKIVFRKFLFDLIGFFLLVSLSLSLITWIIQSVNYLDFISKDGHGFKVYFSFILLNFPKVFSKIIIFSFFVSLFFVINKYQTNNEILIFWINGIGKVKLINFIIKISILLTILQIIFVYFLIPKTQDYSRDFIRSSNIDMFTSLINEKKFIDTVKNFTIFVESIDDQGNFQNIFLKDSIETSNNQIISAKSGKIVEDGSSKYLNLKYGFILDMSQNDIDNTKVIKFNTTTFNLSNLKTKSTTKPKIQEMNSKILISCVKNFFIGDKVNYTITNFRCNEDSSIKSFKELFNRTFKQLYIIVLGTIASALIFVNEKSPKNYIQKLTVFFTGILIIVISEINVQFLSFSLNNNIIYLLFPALFFFTAYLSILNFNRSRS
mgnify:FL=1